MTRISSSSAASSRSAPAEATPVITDPNNEATVAAPGTSARRPRRGLASARRVARTVGSSVVVLWGAATVAFFAQLALPGDRATIILNIRAGQPQLRTADELAQINAEFGLDRPVIVQYLDYLGGLIRGDFGTSYQQFRPVAAVIGEQLGST